MGLLQRSIAEIQLVKVGRCKTFSTDPGVGTAGIVMSRASFSGGPWCSHEILLEAWMCCKVGWDDLSRSFPTPTILWFYEIILLSIDPLGRLSWSRFWRGLRGCVAHQIAPNAFLSPSWGAWSGVRWWASSSQRGFPAKTKRSLLNADSWDSARMKPT